MGLGWGFSDLNFGKNSLLGDVAQTKSLSLRVPGKIWDSAAFNFSRAVTILLG